MGTNQVSVNTKMVKATWIAALVQPYLSAIGLTNSVQPYCRFAIIAMQTMPMTNCIHRYEAGLVIVLSTAASASLRIDSSFSVPPASDVPGERNPHVRRLLRQGSRCQRSLLQLIGWSTHDRILLREDHQ